MGATSTARPSRKAVKERKPINDYPELDDLEEEVTPTKKRKATGDFYKDTQQDDVEEDEISEIDDWTRQKGNETKLAKQIKKKTKKRKIERKSIRQASPKVSDMSEEENEPVYEEDLGPFEKKTMRTIPTVTATLLPKVLRLEIRSAPTTININLADFIPAAAVSKPISASDNDMDGTTLLDDPQKNGTSAIGAAKDPKSVTDTLLAMRRNPKYASFLELEPSLRNRIYRDVLVKTEIVNFNPASPGLARTSALLRTCNRVHEEARGILYGENAFHFDRTDRSRGGWLDEEWKEVGYKDVRRFLESIGQENLSRMRFLDIDFSDAIPSVSPGLTTDMRRFVNDPVLHHVIRLIGNSGAVFEKFAVCFRGRAMVSESDGAFIRALTAIRCRELIKTCKWGHSWVSGILYNKMKDFMQVKDLDEIDQKRQRAPKMQYEIGYMGSCRGRGWCG